jgi:NitT/TauT family transport system substrate-binding protein
MTEHNRWWAWVLFLLAGVFVAVFVVFQNRFWEDKQATIDLAVNNAAIASAPVFVLDPGGLGNEGSISDIERTYRVDVQTVGFPSGKLALDALLSGSVDVATAAETPVVLARNHPEIRVLATMTRSRFRIIADSTRGINSVKDLEGKQVGAPEGTSAQFFLSRILGEAGLAPTAIKFVNTQPGDLVSSFVRGDVDAISVWEPLAARALDETPGKGITIEGDSTAYIEHFLIVTTEAKLTEKGEQIKRMLASLIAATESLRINPQVGIESVARRVMIDSRLLNKIWGRFDFPMNLDKRVITTMENVEGWAAEKKGIPPRSREDLARIIAPELLRSVEADRVMIK